MSTSSDEYKRRKWKGKSWERSCSLCSRVPEMRRRGCNEFFAFLLLLFMSGLIRQIHCADKVTCFSRTRCFLKERECPKECPEKNPADPKARACEIDCYSPLCQPVCMHQRPNCKGPGAVCLDPRFIGGDGVVFYFHGRRNEHFSLVSDHHLQINARFIGTRPPGRKRDFTWIQALGILFDSQSLSVEATPASSWDDQVDHLKFTYNGEEMVIPEGYLSGWESPHDDLRIERTSVKNSVTVTLPDVVKMLVKVVPITKEDDRIHSYRIPPNDCFAHLEVQFRFHALSPEVDGVLGRTYQPDFKNPAKPGVAIPVVGGEDRYKTKSLLSADCAACMFSPAKAFMQNDSLVMDYGFLDCSRAASGGTGIVCRR